MTNEEVSDLKAGKLIIQSPAYVHVISNSSVQDSVCDNCLDTPNIYDNLPPVKLSRCSGCKQSFYCNVQCQKQAWPLHKLECKYLQRISPRKPPSIVKLILRMCLKHKLHPHYSETLPDGSIRTLNDLKTHKEEITASIERSEAFASYIQVIKACVGDMFSNEELLETYCKVLINCTEITDAMGNIIGTGLYLGLSAIDHSCSPNVNVVFNKNYVELRSLTSIPSPTWQNVRVSYINTVLPKHMRQARLKEDYYFSCKCSKCTDDQDMDIYCQGATVCPKCKGPVGISQTKCDACGREVDPDRVTGSDVFFQEDLDDCQLIKEYRKLQSVFHIYDFRMVEFCEKALAACLNLSDYELFYKIGEHLLVAYKQYFSLNSVSFGLHLAKLAKVAIYLNKNSEALDYLNQCFKIFKISHGGDSLMISYLYSLRDSISI